MNWVLLALLAPFIYAVNVFIDKYLISSKIRDYRGLPIFGIFLSIVVIVFFWLVSGVNITFSLDSLLVILTGVLTIWGFSLYLEALIKEETSLVIILLQLTPVMVLLLSYFILGEMMTVKQLIGFGLLLISSLLVSVKKEKSRMKFNRGVVFILLADLCWAATYILIKFTSNSLEFASLIIYESMGVVLGGVLLLIFFSQIREAFLKIVAKVKKPVIGIIFLNEALYLGAKILTYFAVTLGPPVLISIIGSTQIFYGILLGVILTLVVPKVFKEDLSRKSLVRKVSLGLMAFVGVILVS